ncbi:NAD-dependent succinate-semialdehyde dehydrogenase [Flavobacterium salilacus subsp. salilacus]|uniref:NAD-dependent succinate-semialdehyde dehydrogenase n=1 Tax=Flavobacterium TaxID=237 RepID=UPI00107531F2|nr:MULTISPECIES: NAD-dependent succinate-semialdehyde dehydrogenase [Flavobacterium]KAF2516249.1 NAD-dependent succinate-semialdehyde dehydrogenase [Flavobacterium salilacus subsp. salilacus]MBE1613777.1 NAD-dependent succinate-semialdehyde dehydrogenase [Flavobacterium sp. SaA2.13]
MFSNTNPFNLTFLSEYQYITDIQAVSYCEASKSTFNVWKTYSLHDRLKLIENLIYTLSKNKDALAKQCTLEMGKPIKQSVAEVEKCILLCKYYLENALNFLSPHTIKTDGTESFVTFEPLGVILGVMPWNFPYWQVFRFAIPSIIAGNTVVLKHASNVAGCGILLEKLFIDAGFPEGTYKNLLISGEQVANIIDLPFIKAVSLTGSEKAGASVASKAAGLIKKSVLELGGSNAFIVLKDADIEKAVATAVTARMQNTGQSCIAAKRFLVHQSIYDVFIDKFKTAVQALKTGNPMEEDADIGPLARVDLAEEIEKQVVKSVEMGAKIVIGGKRDNAFYTPTIMTDITTDMPVFNEEVFGPVAPVIPFDTFEEAVELSNGTEFGLGVTIFTEDREAIKKKIHLFEEGAVFINALVKSDPALPFGGVKKSGYGRELAENGIKEFVNVKTVYIK